MTPPTTPRAQVAILKEMSPELHRRLLAVQQATPRAQVGPLRALVVMAYQEGAAKAATASKAKTTSAKNPAKWAQAAAKLRRQIDTGAIAEGESLSITQLAEEYGVGRATMTKVFRLLAEEGYLRLGVGCMRVAGLDKARF